MIALTSIKNEAKAIIGASENDSDIVAANVQSTVRSILTDEIEAYRWSDANLAKYVNDAVAEIRRYRPDSRVDSFGSARTVVDIDENFTGNLSLRQDFKSAVIFYAVSRAFELDADDQQGNQQLFNQYLGRFSAEVANAPYNWNDSEINNDIYRAVLTVTVDRPDSAIDEYGERKAFGELDQDDDEYDLDINFFNLVVSNAIELVRPRLPQKGVSNNEN